MKKNILLISFCLLLSVCKSQAGDTLFCQTYGDPIDPNGFNFTGYNINGIIQDYNGCSVQPAIMIAIIDSATCEPLTTCGNNFGQANQFTLTSGLCNIVPFGTGTCRNRPEKYFIFRFSNSVEINSMIQLLGSTGNGSYILAYTWFTYAYSTMTNFTTFKNAFINLGATAIATISDTVPYIFFGRKGTPSSVNEVVGTHANDTIDLQVVYQCLLTSINEISEAHSLTVFPNPSTGIFNFQFNDRNDQIKNIEITDVVGRVVNDLSTNSTEVNMSSAASGIYFYQLKTTRGKTFQGKIAIE